MSAEKKAVRKYFRDACYKRDGYRCAVCGMKSSKDKAEEELDAHHITDRRSCQMAVMSKRMVSLCARLAMKKQKFSIQPALQFRVIR